VDYPPFNRAHPPLMEKPDIWPPQRTTGEMIGKPFNISDKYFYGVHDPQFPWVGMSHSSPDQWHKWKKLQEDQKAKVDHYVVVRTQYWNQTSRAAYGAETVKTQSHTVGTTYTHTKTTQDSTTTRIGIDLGLNLGGNIFSGGDVPPVPPVALLQLPMSTPIVLADKGDDNDSPGGSELSANFSWEFSHTLDITTTDESTYTEERTITTETTFLANTQYIFWQIWEDLAMYRVRIGQTNSGVIATGQSISTITSKTSTVYVQPFDMTMKSSDDDSNSESS
jgi:hypothetical protein